MSPHSALTLFFSATSVFLSSCGEESGPTSAAPEEPPAVTGKWVRHDDADGRTRRAYVERVLKTIRAREFRRLEEMAEFAREDGSRMPDGGFTIHAFYSAFGDFHDWEPEHAVKGYPELLALITDWEDEIPASPTPLVAKASCFLGYGWHARGKGWRDSVPEENWKLFADRLESAFEILADPHNAPVLRGDPNAWYVFLRTARGAGFEKEKLRELFLTAQEEAPTYWGNYQSIALTLLPRWHGSTESEWHEWLTKALRKELLDEKTREEIYAHVVLRMIDFAYQDPRDPNPFEVAGVDWDRLRSASLELLKSYPRSSTLPALLLRAATLRKDEATIREALLAMEFRYDPEIWPGTTNAEFFRLLRNLKSDFPDLATLIE